MIRFNPDGSLQVKKKKKKDHIIVFLFISELSFPLGKKLLVQGLRGDLNEKTKKCFLHKKIYFGELGGYTEEELLSFIDVLITRGFLEIEKQKGIYQVVVLSKKGKKELEERAEVIGIDDSLREKDKHQSEQFIPPQYSVSTLNDEEKILCSQLDFFLKRFTDEQKKAIICADSKQLCIAGAGSGKTSVLTQKIAYLVQFKGVPAKEILAITFTRKAKQEMIQRLSALLPGEDIRVETFNSFAEQELLKNGSLFYGMQKRMVSSKEFNQLVIKGLKQLGYSVDMFLDHYFTSSERRGKEQGTLFFSFLYDFRSILDSYIRHHEKKDYFEQRIASAKFTEKITAQTIIKLCSFVHKELEEEGLRTYSDQLIDINELYTSYPHLKKIFSWVLVDEYQDVSSEQKELISLLNPRGLFVVGDPRQSIYAWRGANPNTIFEYIDDATTVIELTTNFRSTQEIVLFANKLIAQTNNGTHSYVNLHSSSNDLGRVFLTHYKNEEQEVQQIIDIIKGIAAPRSEIFILCRTNKSLLSFQELCDQNNISYVLRTDEKKDLDRIPFENEITLSTVHSSKGLEAEFVFVTGVNFLNYPCKSKDHHYVDLLASKEEYDQFEEERRLLYVACTRAKKELYLSYAGGISPFLSRKVLQCISAGDAQKNLGLGIQKSAVDVDIVQKQRSLLKRWRFLEAQERSIPAYMIFSNKALEELLQVQPMTVEELLDITGLGKAKVQEFGEDILRVMYS